MRILSMKGVPVDMAAVIAQNEGTIAVSNTKMNARGDQLGRGGEIIKEREQIAREYHQTVGPKAVKHVPLKDIKAEVLMSGPAKAAQTMTFQDPAEALAEVFPEGEKGTRRRKLKDD